MAWSEIGKVASLPDHARRRIRRMPRSNRQAAQLINAARFEEALSCFQGYSTKDGTGLGCGEQRRGSRAGFDGPLSRGTALLHRGNQIQPYPVGKKALSAERAMAIGYGFAGDCADAEKLEKRAFEFYVETLDFPNAGDVADELRPDHCLDAGDWDRSLELVPERTY